MAVITTYSLQFMLESVKKEHDLTTDTLKIALLDTDFTFDASTHSTYADCSSDEISAGNGYVTGGETMTNVNAAINAVTNKVDLTATSVTWTASGGYIPASGAAIIYNNSHVNKTVIMCIDFGANYSTADGRLFQINLANGFGRLSNAA